MGHIGRADMEAKPAEIWTIGHSTRSIGEFTDLLRANRIRILADVRRFPGSRRHPHFGSEALAEALRSAGIAYQHLPELGGRRTVQTDSPNTAWRNAAFRGYADYMGTKAFRLGIEKLLVLAQQERTVMMCAEALWWQCHRSLISDYLKAEGHTVWHILSSDEPTLHPFSGAARLVNGKLSYRAAESQRELPLPR